jgi:hypothetical protein
VDINQEFGQLREKWFYDEHPLFTTTIKKINHAEKQKILNAKSTKKTPTTDLN